MTKFAFSCSTKYQLMNIITFVFNNIEDSQHDSDLYLYYNKYTHSDFKQIREKLLLTDIFKNIFLIKDIQYSSSNFKRKIKTLYLLLRAKNYLLNNISPFLLEKDEYTCAILVIPCSTLIFEILIRTLNPNKIYFIEDGLGSYIGDINKSTTTKGHRLFNKIFKKEISPQNMYVRNLDLYKGSMNISVNKLPDISNKSLINLFTNLFELEDIFEYEKYKFIFLDQPLFEISNTLNKEKIQLLENITFNLKNNILVRKHPRTRKEIIKCSNIDDSANFWEYLCYRNIKNRHTLISVTSTAMFSPYLLFHKEPYLIFLFKLFSFSDAEKDQYNDIISLLKEQYQNKNKIFIPSTFNEFREIIDNMENYNEQ